MNTAKHHISSLRQVPCLPPDSELPPGAPPPLIEDVVPNPGAAGGLDNIPEALLPASEAATDELDHAGLDAVLPDEDQGPVRPVDGERETKPAEKWGHL